ncbi:unnamed protein product [Urochloa humidicola]
MVPSHRKRPALRVGFRPTAAVSDRGAGWSAEPNMSRALDHGWDEATGRVRLTSSSPHGRLAPPVVTRQEQAAHFTSSPG